MASAPTHRALETCQARPFSLNMMEPPAPMRAILLDPDRRKQRVAGLQCRQYAAQARPQRQPRAKHSGLTVSPMFLTVVRRLCKEARERLV